MRNWPPSSPRVGIAGWRAIPTPCPAPPKTPSVCPNCSKGCNLVVGYHPPEFDGEQAQITEAFRGLSGADRELLALSAWEGLDYGQIAVVLGCSRNAVRLRLFRARKQVARLLADEPEPGERGS